MRTLGTLGVVAFVSLLSNGAVGRPIPPRVIHPYPIYHSDDLLALDLRSGGPILESRAHLELSLAAFSKAIEVGFVNVVIRPREHLVSLSRYYKLPERLPTFSIDTKQGLGWPTNNLNKRHDSGGSESARANTDSFPIHNRQRRGSDDPDAEAVRSPDYRRHTGLGRSSTHAVGGEHLKAKKNASS